MPPRYAYWTILIDNKPTAFRAREKEELLPTFHQLQRTNKDVVMKWFARGRLWNTPEEARAEARKPASGERRGRDWRPGGAHEDPRDRFKKKARERRADGRPAASRRDNDREGREGRRPPKSGVAQVLRPAGDKKPFDRNRKPPHGQTSWSGKPPSGPPRENRPWSGKPPSGAPRGNRPWSGKPSSGPPRENRPWSGKPPSGPPRGDRPWSGKPPSGPPRGDRPWSNKPGQPGPHGRKPNRAGSGVAQTAKSSGVAQVFKPAGKPDAGPAQTPERHEVEPPMQEPRSGPSAPPAHRVTKPEP